MTMGVLLRTGRMKATPLQKMSGSVAPTGLAVMVVEREDSRIYEQLRDLP
jgi:hypothetical protein